MPARPVPALQAERGGVEWGREWRRAARVGEKGIDATQAAESGAAISSASSPCIARVSERERVRERNDRAEAIR